MIHFAEKGNANEDDQAIIKPFHSCFFLILLKIYFLRKVFMTSAAKILKLIQLKY